MQRYFFSGATEADARQAGARQPAARAARAREARPRRRRRGRPRPPRDLGSRRLAPRARRGRRECGGCCRTSCSQARTDHVPVLAERGARVASAVQPGETVVDATFGAGGHAALLAADLHGRGKLIAIDRDPTARTYFERLEKRARRAGAAPARRLRRRAAAARRERRARRRDPARPRRLVDAARPARARLLVLRRRAARHAHGHVAGPDGARHRQRVAASASS